MNTIENIRGYAPGFAPIFPIIEKIINTDGVTDELFLEGVVVMATKIRSTIADQQVLRFLDLPAWTHFSSSLMRKKFLESVLLVALDQATDQDKGNNCFAVKIRTKTLEKYGFEFKTREAIKKFGEKISGYIPCLSISAHGEGPNADETYLNVYYVYGNK